MSDADIKRAQVQAERDLDREHGWDAYHGRTGFDTFSHLKPIFTQAKRNGMGLLAPPYGKTFAAILKILLR